MKKRIFTLFLALVALLALASCGKEKSADIFDIFEDSAYTDYNMSEISGVEVTGSERKYNQYFYHSSLQDGDKTTHYLYSIAKPNTVVAKEQTASDYISIKLVDEYAAVTVTKYDNLMRIESQSVEVYDKNGVLVISKYNVENSELTVYDEHFYLDKAIYKRTGELVKDLGPTGFDFDFYENTVDAAYADGRYIVLTSDTGATISVFDKNFNNEYFYSFPPSLLSGDSTSLYILSGGNVLVQTLKSVDSESTKYDLVLNGAKKNIEQYIYDVKKGELKENNLECLVLGVIKGDGITEEISFASADKLESLLVYTEIENKHASDQIEYAFLSNGGKRGAAIESPDGFKDATILNNERASLFFYYGTYLYSTDGERICELKEEIVGVSKSYIVTEKAIYDLNMTALYTFEEGIEVLDVLYNDAVILEKEVEDTFTTYVWRSKEIGLDPILIENRSAGAVSAGKTYYRYTRTDEGVERVFFRKADGAVIFEIEKDKYLFSVNESDSALYFILRDKATDNITLKIVHLSEK